MATGGSKGSFVYPTLFDNLKEDMIISKEEIFGPVLGVLPVQSMEKALETANNSNYGLHATVFTKDVDKAFSWQKI